MVKKTKIVAIIPAYNEENTIKDTIENLLKINLISKVVVVNDGSTDKTQKIAEKMGVEVISFQKNHGKGFAIKFAIKKINFDYLVLVDGDLGKSSIEILKLIYPVINNETDLTIAKFQKPSKKGGIGLVKGLAKYGVYIFTGKKIDTTLSGQRVYKKEVINSIRYIPNNYGIEVAMTVGALRKGFDIKEVDVKMTHRETGRNVKGFIHRGKQFLNISKTLLMLMYKR